MYRIYITLIEIMAAAVFIIPLWMLYHKICFHSWKRTMIYMVFAFYMTAVLALVGFPNITLLKIEVTVNVIPFIYMIPDFANACLNVLLFIPFGFFLPTLWEKFRNVKSTIVAGLLTTLFIEISQLFTGRATDIDDVITNILGTIIGYYIACWFTKAFTGRVLKNSKQSDFNLICGSVVIIMFFFQPFISNLLWKMVL